MCYSVVSMVSQSKEVQSTSAESAAASMNPNSIYQRCSTTTTDSPTSGYSSYMSPSESSEASPGFDRTFEMEMNGYDDAPNPRILHKPGFPPHSSVPLSSSYSKLDSPTFIPRTYEGQAGYHSHPYMEPNNDPIYSPAHQNSFHLQSPHYCANGSRNFPGMLPGPNIFFPNYPQGVEGLSPTSQNLALQQQMCKICGDVASGNHFGVLSCEACKSFFRRSVRANARYACRGSRNCAIEKHTRNRCQYCRLQKCLNNGMRKEGIFDLSLTQNFASLISIVEVSN